MMIRRKLFKAWWPIFCWSWETTMTLFLRENGYTTLSSGKIKLSSEYILQLIQNWELLSISAFPPQARSFMDTTTTQRITTSPGLGMRNHFKWNHHHHYKHLYHHHHHLYQQQHKKAIFGFELTDDNDNVWQAADIDVKNMSYHLWPEVFLMIKKSP